MNKSCHTKSSVIKNFLQDFSDILFCMEINYSVSFDFKSQTIVAYCTDDEWEKACNVYLGNETLN